jgi:hypothetical protein
MSTRWFAVRNARGLKVRSDRGRYYKWIAPTIGARPMVAITRRNIKEVVQ